MIIFDFDGVLIDSQDETLLSTFNALTGKFLLHWADLPPIYVKLFRLNRCRPCTAAEMMVLADWCLKETNPRKLLSKQEFADLVKNSKNSSAGLQAVFFSTRNKLADYNHNNWFSLNRPYEPLWEALKAASLKPVILTNKNARAVMELCSHYGIPVPREQIFCGEQAASKLENFHSIHRQFSAKNYLFIDDALSNLQELKQGFKKNLRLALADWGYVGPEDLEQAQNAGIEVFSQETLIKNLNL